MTERRSQVFVQKEMLPSRPAPKSSSGVIGWLRRNLFASLLDSLMTIFFLILLAVFLPPALSWLFLDAAWFGEGRNACIAAPYGGDRPDGWSGMCWPFINAKIGFFIYGYYPEVYRWRVDLVLFLFAMVLIPFACPRCPYKFYNAIALCVVFPVVSAFLLLGAPWFGLPIVPTGKWGGLLLTLVVSFVGILIAFPLGVLLALGRRSEMPVVRLGSVGFIEFIRGVPLITVLFFANIVLPLFLPSDVTISQLFRVLVGVGLFTSAYVAEVIRGGLQGIDKGQYDGARSLGLGNSQMMMLVVLPQALKASIPGLVNTFISLFKDTTLVYTISMLDLLGIVRQHFADTDWISPQTAMSGLVFAGAVFWVFCFGVSRYSAFLERYLRPGYR